MSISQHEVRSRYQKTARFYDFALRLYGLIGIRKGYRLKTIKLLDLQPGDRIVELGCGTGINFPLIMDQIGEEGQLIGVDISPRMLDRARARVQREGWGNVKLIQSDLTEYVCPEEVTAVLSTGVFGYIDDYDSVIASLSQTILPGGHIAIMDGRRPTRMPAWLFNLFVWLSQPFGVTQDYFDKRSWESVERYFQETTFESMYGGMLFIASGTTRSRMGGVEASGKNP